MKKYIDLIGVGAMLALITIASLDLYVYDQQPKIEPVAYPSQKDCSNTGPNKIGTNCRQNDEFFIYEDSRTRTIDISVQHMK